MYPAPRVHVRDLKHKLHDLYGCILFQRCLRGEIIKTVTLECYRLGLCQGKTSAILQENGSLKYNK